MKLFKILFVSLLLILSINIINADNNFDVETDSKAILINHINNDVIDQNNPSIYDQMNIFTPQQLEQLSGKIDEIRKKHNMDVVVVLLNSLNGQNAEKVADDFYDATYYKQDGILLLLSVNDKGWYISTKGKGIEYFTDYGIDTIFQKMKSYLAENNYYDAVNVFADTVDKYIADAKKGHIVGGNSKKSFTLFNGILSAIVGAISSGITSLILKDKMKSMQMKKYAGSYIVDNSFVLNGSSDMLVDTKIEKKLRSSTNSNDASSSKTHQSSSGSTHGGHGGHF